MPGMSAIRLVLFACLGVLVSAAQAGLRDYPFRVESVSRGDGADIVATNEGPATVTVRVALTESENVRSDQRWPLVAVVAPAGTLTLGRVTRDSPLAGFRYGLRYQHQFGDIAAVHDAQAAYRLPFEDGRVFMVSQAPGGVITTHTTPDSAQAIDIAMPERTAIVAARAGVVVDIENFHVRGGKDEELLDKANTVTIQHDDGTLARYVHLVAGQYSWIGQRVEVGMHIGYSGNTGYSSGPHLHFAVMRLEAGADGALGYVSVPITFWAHAPPVRFAARQGMLLSSEYRLPGEVPPVLPFGREGRPGSAVQKR
jgi:murein DD-endopeptidase MepM/ murein hydrolase activator NlpD